MNEKNKIYECKCCGISLRNRANWCDLGCGSDYNEMRELGEYEAKVVMKEFETYFQKRLKEILPEKKELVGNLSNTSIMNGLYYEKTSSEVKRELQESTERIFKDIGPCFGGRLNNNK